MDSSMLLYAIGEVALLLLCICIYLLFHINGLKKLIKKLEEKILALRDTITTTKSNAKSLIKEAKESGVTSYLEFIEQQLGKTREYHQSLSPDRDIVLDLDVEVELERQIAALRNAFLVSEKEATYAGDEENPSWDVLKVKLEQLINFYQHAFKSDESAAGGSSGIDETEFEQLQEELNNFKKRVGNLEKFKKLFFDMEEKFSSAKAEAEDYYQQLKARAKEIDAGEDFDQLLEQYSNAYSSIGQSLEDGKEIESGAESNDGAETIPAVRTEKVYIRNQDELDNLRNMMANQHGIISQLKQKLEESSGENSEQLVEEMTDQLSKQERFLKESEACIQLLEDELQAANQQISDLSKQLTQLKTDIVEGGADDSTVNSEAVDSDVDEVKAEGAPSDKAVEELVAGYVTESRDMLNTIYQLERENKELKEKLERGGFGEGKASDGQAEELRTKLSEVQQELLNLQTQHIELEERYIELKASTL